MFNELANASTIERRDCHPSLRSGQLLRLAPSQGLSHFQLKSDRHFRVRKMAVGILIPGIIIGSGVINYLDDSFFLARLLSRNMIRT